MRPLLTFVCCLGVVVGNQALSTVSHQARPQKILSDNDVAKQSSSIGERRGCGDVPCTRKELPELLSDEQVEFPPFDNAMLADKQYYQSQVHFSQVWTLYRNLYNEYILQRPFFNPLISPYKIPKIIHIIWLGSALPDFAKKMLDSWKKFHPSWEVKLWTDEDLACFPLRNQEAFDRTKNFGKKSDIWRYEILEKFGGVYVDCDFECIKPLDDLHRTVDFYTGIGDGRTRPKLLNGIIGCRPHHPLIEACINSINPEVKEDSFQEILESTGPVFFTNCITNWLLQRNDLYQDVDPGIVVGFPTSFFYPFPDHIRQFYTSVDDVKKDWLRPETFAIHYWALSWFPTEPRPPLESTSSEEEPSTIP